MKKKNMIKLSAVAVIFVFAVWSVLPIFGGVEGDLPEAEGEIPVSAEVKRDYSYNIPEHYAESAIVIDADSGSILFQQNADMIRGMASTTKIMTALVAIENGLLESECRIPKEAVGIEGSSVYLLEGEVLTLRELLYCMLLESGNDAATAIAIHIGGSVEAFTVMMNEKAAELGLENSHFTNPHGLSDSRHHTTAKELAMITAEAMRYPVFNEIVSTKSFYVRYDGTEKGRFLGNHNKLLSSFEGCIGGKTGYTERDGKCLVSAAERDGLTIIAVTLDDNSPSASHTSLLNGAFDSFQRMKVVAAGEIEGVIPVENGEVDFVTVTNPGDVSVCIPKNEVYGVELVLPEGISAPVEENQILAYAKVTCRGEEVYIISLESIYSVKERKKNLLERLFGK